LSLTLEPDPLNDAPDRIGFKTAEYDSLPGTPPFKWESTRGLGGSFAYNAAETADDMLSAADLVDFLVDTVAKNGNVLINVGPDSYGKIPAIQQAPLLGLGDWMSVNGEAIYNTRPWTRFNNERGRALRYTQTDTALYAIVIGEVEAKFTIEAPDVAWHSVEVLGAEVVASEQQDGLLTLTIDRALAGPAVTVRYGLK
jgi:alpha-L-fucosidase